MIFEGAIIRSFLSLILTIPLSPSPVGTSPFHLSPFTPDVLLVSPLFAELSTQLPLIPSSP